MRAIPGAAAISIAIGCSLVGAASSASATPLPGNSSGEGAQTAGNSDVALDRWGRVTFPKRYIDYASHYGAIQKALAAQYEADLSFARSSGTLSVLQGPWDRLPARDVVYLGVDEGGQRVRLSQISSLWHYEPSRLLLPDFGGALKDQWVIIGRAGETEPIVRIVQLGRALPGMLIRSPDGIDTGVLVQSDGLIDGKDFYFRARDGEWSLSIGGKDVLGHPDWYYEESYGDWPHVGSISEDQAYAFIAKAAALFRSAAPSMQFDHGDDPTVIVSHIARGTVVGAKHEGVAP